MKIFEGDNICVGNAFIILCKVLRLSVIQTTVAIVIKTAERNPTTPNVGHKYEGDDSCDHCDFKLHYPLPGSSADQK